MESTQKKAAQKKMTYALRPLELGDVKQASEVEKEAFPTLWPPTPFRKELNNRLARYLVAYEGSSSQRATATPHPSKVTQPPLHVGVLGKLLNAIKNAFVREENGYLGVSQDAIVGIVGVWYMVDEAHIATIGVRPPFQRKGIGELLLIGCIEQAIARKSRVVTLEVRVSNKEAQALYTKYGFEEVGLRKRYYSDNDEDALIMTTRPIQEPAYQERFRQLVKVHAERWGESERALD